MGYTPSQRLTHFFHVVSNIRPIVWIAIYVCATPVFALIYWALPDGQFRIPEGASTDFGAWLYYSIVTITTLGFGEYTPSHGFSQAITAVEVMCGLIFLGLFLNAVAAMKSEIDVENEIEKQRAAHQNMQHNKLLKSVPMILHTLNVFLAYCYAATTPKEQRSSEEATYNPDFSIEDMKEIYQPSGLPIDTTKLPVVNRLLHSATKTSMVLDSLQQRVDLSIWPDLLEDCFSFVANYQLFSNTEIVSRQSLNSEISNREYEELKKEDLYSFIKENARIATALETKLTKIALNN